jgi:hypothetical protein
MLKPLFVYEAPLTMIAMGNFQFSNDVRLDVFT